MFRSRAFRLLVPIAVAAGLLSLSAVPAHATQTVSSGGGCRGAYAEVGYGYGLDPCAEYASNEHYVDAYAYVDTNYPRWTGTEVRVWMAIAEVDPDGSVTDLVYANTSASDLTTNAATFHHLLYCGFGFAGQTGPLVIDTWITESGHRYGQVESPVFWC